MDREQLVTDASQLKRDAADIIRFEPGGYRYIRGVFQYSAGVAAEPGFSIVRVRLGRLLPLQDGFAMVESHLASIGRPTTAFCACELRSPEPFSEQGFVDFNRQYVQTLKRWGLYRDGANPVARTNVCPEFDKPAGPALHAFSYTIPSDTALGSFIIAGGGEAREGAGEYRDSIVRLGDTSISGLREKVRSVMTEMERRLVALGFGWTDAITTQMYTVHDVGSLVRTEIVERGVTGGLTWQYCRPPVVDIEYEMDVRGAAMEIAL